jgi:ribosomal protein L19E
MSEKVECIAEGRSKCKMSMKAVEGGIPSKNKSMDGKVIGCPEVFEKVEEGTRSSIGSKNGEWRRRNSANKAWMTTYRLIS